MSLFISNIAFSLAIARKKNRQFSHPMQLLHCTIICKNIWPLAYLVSRNLLGHINIAEIQKRLQRATLCLEPHRHTIGRLHARDQTLSKCAFKKNG